MSIPFDTILIILKYIIATMIVIGIVLAPAWLARKTEKGKQDMIVVRLGSWLFGWSVIGWLHALFWSCKK